MGSMRNLGLVAVEHAPSRKSWMLAGFGVDHGRARPIHCGKASGCGVAVHDLEHRLRPPFR